MTNEQTARLRNLIEQAARIGERAVEKYGYPAQELMMVEECGELVTALARVHRGRCSDSNVIEEAVDVIIVALQLGLFLGDERFLELLGDKTARLETRLSK